MGILRKIPEEGLSAAARGILFPELKVRRSRWAQAEERKLRCLAERRKGCARAGLADRAPQAAARLGPFAPQKLRAECLGSLLQLLPTLQNLALQILALGAQEGRGPENPGGWSRGKAVSLGHSDRCTFRCSREGNGTPALFETGPHSLWGERDRARKPKVCSGAYEGFPKA